MQVNVRQCAFEVGRAGAVPGLPRAQCNNNNIYATAAISIRADITLRPGDIVVTENGARVFIGSVESQHKASDFTSAQNYSAFPKINAAKFRKSRSRAGFRWS